jgi:hypothetical protein
MVNSAMLLAESNDKAKNKKMETISIKVQRRKKCESNERIILNWIGNICMKDTVLTAMLMRSSVDCAIMTCSPLHVIRRFRVTFR